MGWMEDRGSGDLASFSGFVDVTGFMGGIDTTPISLTFLLLLSFPSIFHGNEAFRTMIKPVFFEGQETEAQKCEVASPRATQHVPGGIERTSESAVAMWLVLSTPRQPPRDERAGEAWQELYRLQCSRSLSFLASQIQGWGGVGEYATAFHLCGG